MILYKHQQQALIYLKGEPAFALFMDMGTGKSNIILRCTKELKELQDVNKVVIICPNYLKETWYVDHFAPHYEDYFSHYIWNGAPTSKKAIAEFEKFICDNLLRVMIINCEAFASTAIDYWLKIFLQQEYEQAFIVVDESTIIKNPKAKRTEKILKGFRNYKYKAILSGTPTPLSPADLWSQFEFLKPNFFDCNYFQFQHRHIILIKVSLPGSTKSFNKPLDLKDYNIIKNKLSKYEKLTDDVLTEMSIKYGLSIKDVMLINNMKEFTPYKDLDLLNKQIEPITFKVMKKDCLDLPEKIYEKIIVDLNPEQKRIYKELQKDYFSIYKDKELSVVNTCSLLIRLRMITAGLFPYLDIAAMQNVDFENEPDLSQFKKIDTIENNPKIRAIIDDVNTCDPDTSIIIWSTFVYAIRNIYEQMKKEFTCATYYGATPMEERKEIIEKFKNKEIKVLIINPMTGGMGLNLQVSNLHYFYDNSYRADIRQQAEDRSHRIGQKNNVVYKDVIAKDTIDEKVYECIKNKMNVLEYFKKNNRIEAVFSDEFIAFEKDFQEQRNAYRKAVIEGNKPFA